MGAATVVQVLHDLFYVLLQLLVIVVAVEVLSFTVCFIACFILLVIAPLIDIALITSSSANQFGQICRTPSIARSLLIVV